jgi:hypothetical protein
VVKALADDGARGLAITLAARTLTRSIAAHAIGAEVRRALVVDLARVPAGLLGIALVGDPIGAVLTIVARDALAIVGALLFAQRAITDVAITELVVVIDARAATVAGVVRIMVARRTGLVHAHGPRIVEVAGAVAVAGAVTVAGRGPVVGALAQGVIAQAHGVTSNGVAGELTRSATVAGAAAKARACALVLGIGPAVAVVAGAQTTGLVTLLAQPITGVLTAYTVDAMVGGAVRALFARRTLGVVQATFRRLLVTMRPLVAVAV